MPDLSHVIAIGPIATSSAGLLTAYRATQIHHRTRHWVRAIERTMDDQLMLALVRPDLEPRS